jgi:hypothetical protein
VGSGVALFLSDATRPYRNLAFLFKSVFLVLVALNAWIFRRVVYRDVALWDQCADPPAGAKISAGVSLRFVASSIAASRIIGFVGPEY